MKADFGNVSCTHFVVTLMNMSIIMTMGITTTTMGIIIMNTITMTIMR